MTPQQQAARLHRIAARLPSGMDLAVRSLADWTRGRALTLSSGRVRQAVFDTPLGASDWQGRRLTNYRHGMSSGLGHPYGHGSNGSLGKRGPVPYGDPAIVNVQSGRFFRAWHLRPGTNFTVHLVNDAPYARYLLDGTTLMIRRPFLGRLAAEARAEAPRFLALGLAHALR